MDKLSGESSLPGAVRFLEQLMRAHIVALESSDRYKALTSSAPEPQAASDKPHPARVTRKGTKLGIDGEAPREVIKRKEQVSVFVRIVFLKIGVIDTIHDRFSAEVLIQTKWREPTLDGRKRANDEVNFDDYWNPKVSISNGIGELRYTTTVGLDYEANGRAWIIEKRRTNGNFFEFMELNKFPFDGQDLTITITSERVDSELEFLKDEREECGVNGDAFSSAQEWKLHDKVNIWTKTNVKKVNKKKMKYPCFCVAAKVARRPQFFIYNIIVIMFAISSLAFATFTVKMESPEARLPLTFFLVLTTVTFKFVVNKSLPKISYLTYLDKYILGSMVILCFVCIWHSMIGSFIHSYTQPDPSTTVTTVHPLYLTTAEPLNHTTSASAASAATSSSVCPSITKPASTTLGRMIDKIALGFFAFIYIGFHLVFLILILRNTDDDGVNEELNIDDGGDEADDEETAARKQESRTKLAMMSLGWLNNGAEKSPPANDTRLPMSREKKSELPTVQE